MAVPTWSVGDVCAAIGGVVAEAFPDELWVRGRIHGMRRTQPGHLYLDLTDSGPGSGEPAWDTPKLSVVAFRGKLRGIEAVLAKVGGLKLEDGLEVRIRGRLDYYPPQGRVQLLMNAIDPRHTLGQLAVDRAAVLRALTAEGLVGRNGAMAMPDLPLRIGLVTSAGSAAFEDFCHELATTPFAFRVLHADARVQGADAEATLVAGLQAVARAGVDVICIVRGGGARTDLLAFDGAAVARAVATAPVPVLVGIGHEIDRSVVDEVAHTSLKTPTACAAALVARVAGAVDRLDRSTRTLDGQVRRHLAAATARLDERSRRAATVGRRVLADASTVLDARAARIPVRTRSQLDARSRQVDRSAATLASVAGHHVRRAARRADEHRARLVTYADRPVRAAADRITQVDAIVRAVHPDRTLALGYSITRDGAGRAVRSATDVRPGDRVRTELSRGTIESTVTDTTDDPDVPHDPTHQTRTVTDTTDDPDVPHDPTHQTRTARP